MAEFDRRAFLTMLGVPALAAVAPTDLTHVLAIPANDRTRSIKDVEHVVILMQENRSFDHYFGTLRGVRGFSDPHPVTLASGRSVWHQPNGAGELLPFRPDVADLGRSYLPDPPHGWNDTHAAWNNGRFDAWVPNKGIDTMTYHTRKDLPYQFALADAFTVCDNYHCSLLGPTDPNRYHMWTGWVGNDGKAGGPVITNAEAGYDWSTYPERLERAGISWKVYQDVGVGLTAAGYWGWTDDPYIGNYGDNSLLYFHQYQNAAAGTPLADRARSGTQIQSQNRNPLALLSDFKADVKARRLPQVTWIVAPEAFSEHPNWAPDLGAWYVSQVVDTLASDPDLWSRTALFITYDEEGGFFDHLVPPTPPQSRTQGLSSVSTTNEIFPGNADHPSGPYGLGIRVPMIVVSPWTRGGWVNSQLFDHTSLIRFLEARFGNGHPDLIESNITPWRRAVTGDLTGAFDFRSPNTKRAQLPSTAGYLPANLVRVPDLVPVPPAVQQVPTQETGVRPSRALPYALHADAQAHGPSVIVSLRNVGSAAAVYHVRSVGSAQDPRTYTVGPQHTLADSWDAATGYDLEVHGPNGFFRRFADSAAAGAGLGVEAHHVDHDQSLGLELTNNGAATVRVTVTDEYTGHLTTLSVKARSTVSRTWSLSRTKGWYDLSLAVVNAPGFAYRYAGHVEDGHDSISDPRLGGLG